MKPVSQRIFKLFKVLQTAYQERPGPLPGDQWQRDVMRRIHCLARSRSSRLPFSGAGRGGPSKKPSNMSGGPPETGSDAGDR